MDEDSKRRIATGDYPTRIKSKTLAKIRDIVANEDRISIIGFLPEKEMTIEHYDDLALYLSLETPCPVVSDLIVRDDAGNLTCKKDIIKKRSVIVISDNCSAWGELLSCLERTEAKEIRCISITSK